MNASVPSARARGGGLAAVGAQARGQRALGAKSRLFEILGADPKLREFRLERADRGVGVRERVRRPGEDRRARTTPRPFDPSIPVPDVFLDALEEFRGFVGGDAPVPSRPRDVASPRQRPDARLPADRVALLRREARDQRRRSLGGASLLPGLGGARVGRVEGPFEVRSKSAARRPERLRARLGGGQPRERGGEARPRAPPPPRGSPRAPPLGPPPPSPRPSGPPRGAAPRRRRRRRRVPVRVPDPPEARHSVPLIKRVRRPTRNRRRRILGVHVARVGVGPPRRAPPPRAPPPTRARRRRRRGAPRSRPRRGGWFLRGWLLRGLGAPPRARLRARRRRRASVRGAGARRVCIARARRRTLSTG